MEWIKSSRSYGYGECVELARWTKSSFSKEVDCVEVGQMPEGVAVRDSKDPGGPVLRFTSGEFAAFLDGAKAGEFDHLVAEETA